MQSLKNRIAAGEFDPLNHPGPRPKRHPKLDQSLTSMSPETIRTEIADLVEAHHKAQEKHDTERYAYIESSSAKEREFKEAVLAECGIVCPQRLGGVEDPEHRKKFILFADTLYNTACQIPLQLVDGIHGGHSPKYLRQYRYGVVDAMAVLTPLYEKWKNERFSNGDDDDC